MTEGEWLESEDPTLMLEFLRGKGSYRKVRLFAATCCRRIWHLLADEQVRKVVGAIERHAEGSIVDSTMDRWSKRVADARDGIPITNGFTPEWLAYHAVAYASGTNHFNGYVVGYNKMVPVIAAMTGQVKGSAAWNADETSEFTTMSRFLKDIFANPFRPISINPIWLTPTILTLAQAAYDERIMPSGELEVERLAVLSDALEEAGCDNEDILNHLRSPGPHVRGCWCLDLLTGRS